MSTAWRHVLLATDLGPGSDVPFSHALGLALASRGTLTTVHVTHDGDEASWSALPTVRETLVRWGRLPEDATLDHYLQLGVRVRMHAVPDRDAVHGLVAAIEEHGPFDLVVIGAHHRAGLERWLERSVSGSVLRQSHAPTLVVPDTAHTFVATRTGKVSLEHALVPVDSTHAAQAAVDAVFELATSYGVAHCRGTLVHIGDADTLPELDLPEGWAWGTWLREGDVVEEILRVEQEIEPDLVCMATRGHDGPLDFLRGSHVDRVLARTRCPVLGVPYPA